MHSICPVKKFMYRLFKNRSKVLENSTDIHIRKGVIKRAATVEIHIQGGIVAESGLRSSFMVNSVLAITKERELQRNDSKTPDSGLGQKKSDLFFSQILQKAVEKEKSAPTECNTTTYGPDGRLVTFRYQTREYH